MNWSNIVDVIEWCKKNIKFPDSRPNIGEIKIMSLGNGFRLTIAFVGDGKLIVPTIVKRFDVNENGEIEKINEMIVR